MAVKTTHGLPETKGDFKLVGLVTGVKKDNFFETKLQKNDMERASAKFGLETSKDNTIYVQMSDSEKDNVYFYRRKDDKNDVEAKTQMVPWSERFKFNEEGFGLIGTDIRIEQEEVEGKKVNVKKLLTPYDGAKYLNELSKNGTFKDGIPLRIMGNIDYSSFEGKDGLIRFKKFEATKIYNSRIDMDAEDFVEESDFRQKFIYMDTDMKSDDEGKYGLVTGKVVTYSGFEDVEFKVRNKTLATNFKKKLKPYTCINVFGKIVNKIIEEEVETSSDDWGGESDPFARANKTTAFEFLITGIKTEDIDTKTYTKEILEKAMKSDDDFGKDVDDSEEDNWGSDDSDDGEW